MKCPNCNAEVFEGDEYCQECDYYLVEDTLEEILAFIKDALGSPWKSIGRPYRLKTAFTAIGMVAPALLAVGVWQMMSVDSNPFPELQFIITLIPSLIVLAISFVFFYITTGLFQATVTKEVEGGQQVFVDFSKTMFLLYGIYILFAATITSLPDIMIPILWFIIYFLTISVPVFITVKYAGNGNAKFNILLSVLIYYVVINLPAFYVVFLI